MSRPTSTPSAAGRTPWGRLPWRCPRRITALTLLMAFVTIAAAQAPARSDFAAQPTDLLARFDRDGDGQVNEVEYLDYLGLGFRTRDRDGNGVLEGAELPPGERAIPWSEHEARLRRQFARQDANGDARLDRRELLAPPRA